MGWTVPPKGAMGTGKAGHAPLSKVPGDATGWALTYFSLYHPYFLWLVA